jgi:uncharacterized protein YegP (UPF0339 family)
MLRIEMYTDRTGGWRWRGVDTNHRIICDSAESYVSRDNLERAIDNVVVGFRAALQVVCRERRAETRDTDARLYETLVVAEYQAEGDTTEKD